MSPPVMTAGLTPTQTSMSLLGVTAISLALALFLRRRVPGITGSLAARAGSLRGAARGGRGTASSTGPRTGRSTGSGAGIAPLNLVRAAFGWAALLLFAVAGVAATGTFIGQFVLWAARTVDTLVRHLPAVGQDFASAGFGIVAIVALWRGLHLLGDLVEGRAHHGGADALVFLGPMLFPLVPGYFGEGATWVYAGVASHIGPVVAHLV